MHLQCSPGGKHSKPNKHTSARRRRAIDPLNLMTTASGEAYSHCGSALSQRKVRVMPSTKQQQQQQLEQLEHLAQSAYLYIIRQHTCSNCDFMIFPEFIALEIRFTMTGQQWQRQRQQQQPFDQHTGTGAPASWRAVGQRFIRRCENRNYIPGYENVNICANVKRLTSQRSRKHKHL